MNNIVQILQSPYIIVLALWELVWKGLALWKAARGKNNFDSLEGVFELLLNEFGLSLREDAAQAAFGKEIAEKLNARGKDGKKV